MKNLIAALIIALEASYMNHRASKTALKHIQLTKPGKIFTDH